MDSLKKAWELPCLLGELDLLRATHFDPGPGGDGETDDLS